MSITYTIAIDRNDDGDYLDLTEVISADVLEARWRLGMARRYDYVGSPSSAEVIVRNRDGAYSPERSTLEPGRFLRIQSDDGTTTRTHFVGVIATIEPQTGTHGHQLTRIVAHGREAEVASNAVRLAPVINTRSDVVLAAIFDRLKLRYEAVSKYLIIGHSGQNLIGTHWIFPAQAVTCHFDTGKSTFPYVGDTWGDGIPATDAIQEIVVSEGGRFFFNRAGEAVFYNRHHTMTNPTLAATFNDDMAALDYAYGEDRVTEVNIRMTPRSIGIENSIMWSLAQPTRIRRDQTRTITARYMIDDEPVGLLSVLNASHSANSREDGLGVDLTDNVQVVISDAGFSAATIEIRNESGQDVYLHALTLRGQPLIIGHPLTVSERDPVDVALYGLQNVTFTTSLISDIDEVGALAEFLLRQRSKPRGVANSLATNTIIHPMETLSLTLYDRIRIIESQTGHDGTYRIIAEDHHVDRGGARHRVMWLLEPDASEIFFIIGIHSPDSDQIIAPR